MKTGSTFHTVLLIDDQQMAEDLVGQMLVEQDDIRLQYLADSTAAVATAASVLPSVVLVDLRMPGLDGFGVTAAMRADPRTQELPIILLSSEDSADVKVRAFAEGVNDYLVKWPDKRELAARIRYHAGAHLTRKQRDEAFLSLRRSQQELLQRTEELAQSQAALHQAQKMEAIGQLTGGVAHDFNNVLQVISGNLELLRLMTRGNDAAQSRIAAASVGVDRGAKLAAHLLAFARRQPLQSVVINPGRLLRDMSELLRRSLGELTTVETLLEDALWNICVDPSQLENVILNLALNARDAMGPSGRLTIRAQNAVPGGDEANYPERGEGDYVLISVSDTGSGMPPDVLERAFEPFFTTKPAGQGTGLGLSMAYGFVKQSDGHIRLESEPGRGTAVKIFLPRCRELAPARLAPADATMVGGKETILVVEDEHDVRDTTVVLLNNLGYRTCQAADAQDALQILENGTHVDLVFTDVMMPGPLSSVEFADRARTLLPGLQVLFTSGYSEGVIAHGGRLDPRINLLPKPYTAEALSQKIRQLLNLPRNRG
ncbi:MAG TPA: response regulator [Noviherbaspirillum sp.]|jgi:signal transduction histidine kinase|uniref:response regulator n=1 Tax=Noviherbaspirillum sp. TaxID=1926288 RepID=UPI002F9452C7